MERLILGLLLLLGIILILIEILFIPGTTVFGILGLISVFASDYLSISYFGVEFGIIYSITSGILCLLIIIYALKNIHTHKVSKNQYSELSIGDIGISSSSLKPYGKGVFKDKSYEIKSLENFIEENKKIKIINILQDKILVKKIK